MDQTRVSVRDKKSQPTSWRPSRHDRGLVKKMAHDVDVRSLGSMSTPGGTGAPGNNTAANDSMPATTQDDVREEKEVHSARLIKLPPFWKTNPNLWFMQIEAKFQLARVSDNDIRLKYVIISLDPEILPFVSDILESLPATCRYQALKNRILSSFDETSESKLRRL